MSIIDEMREAAKGIKNIIAIGSGKGGVGKSTVTANLAIAIAKKGYKTAILDTDIYGPTIPSFFGVYQQPLILMDKMCPVEKYGVKLMSIGFLVEDYVAVAWRGPLIIGAIKQFFTDVDWGEIDYMFIDLPPGTGDAPLTITQSLPIKGGIIVTTPQIAAVKTAVRAADLFRQLKVPLIGTIINMSYMKCKHCGMENNIFQRNGETLLKDKTGINIIARLPFYEDFMEEIMPGDIKNIDSDKNAREAFEEISEFVIKFCGG